MSSCDVLLDAAPPAGSQVGGQAWRVIGASVRGASHVRRGLPNQDALRWWPDEGTGPPLVLAIADGHGSAKCFRSQIGARLAVDTAVEVAPTLLGGQDGMVDLTAVEDVAQAILDRWQAAVEAHLAETPFSEGELSGLEAESGAGARQAVLHRPLLAYGATLAAVVVTEWFIFYLQLGDGDILTVSEDGVVSRPLPADERLFADQTTSLCTEGAWRDFRIGFQALADTWRATAGGGAPDAAHGPGAAPQAAPALILLSTDGYANSFRDETGFLQVGPDLLGLIRTEGLGAVSQCLESWLGEASRLGSGDDITLAMVCRLPAPPLAPLPGGARGS
ncbi:MAG TPA: PP2C family serine/threonine-protein phosphatase, partial [Chloroflexota bacterium]|nr:PP2C family serine/threonine-protein phosphatase [Chloroflexota bacterium]